MIGELVDKVFYLVDLYIKYIGTLRLQTALPVFRGGEGKQQGLGLRNDVLTTCKAIR